MASTSSFGKLSFIPSDSTFIFLFTHSSIYFNCDLILSRWPPHSCPSSLSFLPTALSSSSFSFLLVYILITTVATSSSLGLCFIPPQQLHHVIFHSLEVGFSSQLHPLTAAFSFCIMPPMVISCLLACISSRTSFLQDSFVITTWDLHHS